MSSALTDFANVLLIVSVAGVAASLHWALRLRHRVGQLTTALDNMSQGLCMFDASARLMVGNKRYLEIYGLSPGRTHIGCTLRDVVRQRIEAGNFSGDPDKYITDTLAEIAEGKPFHRIRNMPDGRTISLSTRPTGGGGWVVTHDDVTEQRAAEEKRASLANQEQRRLQVEAAIRSFRERVEAVLATVADSAGAMRTTATSLSNSSDQSSQRA